MGRSSSRADGRSRSDTVAAVYWRAYHGVWTHELPDAEQSYIAHNDARGLFESLLLRLPTRWVNGWNAFQLHQTKPAALAMVAELGLAIPATLVANDPERLAAFASSHSRVIFKPVQGGAHARRLTPAHLEPENLASLTVSPVTLQEEVAGTNVRVFVAGERVLACEIATGRLDYREDESADIVPHALPDAIAADCLAAAATLDLVWTGIDFRLTPDGRYVFLEANPSPMFLGFEERTGLPLTESLGDLLLGV
jgi:glutathione synthase/RimK-type ligase-like ATP-grasp enzyme